LKCIDPRYSTITTLVIKLFFAGNSPPGQVFIKYQYMIKDLQRLAEYYKVPVQQIAVSYFAFYFQFLTCDASTERGYETVCHLSIRLSVWPSVMFRYHDHTGWNSSKIISRPNSVRPMRSLTPNMGDLVQREHPQN